jgi:hypothetical protein
MGAIERTVATGSDLLGDLLFLVNDKGFASGHDAATGKEIWRRRLMGKRLFVARHRRRSSVHMRPRRQMPRPQRQPRR